MESRSPTSNEGTRPIRASASAPPSAATSRSAVSSRGPIQFAGRQRTGYNDRMQQDALPFRRESAGFSSERCAAKRRKVGRITVTSLRWHYPDQVRRVCGRATLSAARSPSKVCLRPADYSTGTFARHAPRNRRRNRHRNIARCIIRYRFCRVLGTRALPAVGGFIAGRSPQKEHWCLPWPKNASRPEAVR